MDDHGRRIFEAVFFDVYEALQRYLGRRCPAADVDDVLSETLLTIWRRVDEVPGDRPLPWCYGVARRCLANHRRAGTRRNRLTDRIGAAAEPPAGFAWTSTADGALQSALDRLPELDREIIRLWAWEQLEPREIAEVLHTTANAVSVRLTRIRQRLRADLARQDPGPAGHKVPEDHPELEP